jgi:membrane protein required for colicin V production
MSAVDSAQALASGLIWPDFVIIAVVLLSAAISFVRGFLREAISLAAWVVAIWVGLAFSEGQARLLEPWVETPSIRIGLAFAVLFIATLLIGALVNYLFRQLVEVTGIGGMDRFIGLFFGAARGVVIMALVLLLAGLTPLPQDPWWQQSVLISYLQPLVSWLHGWIPTDLRGQFTFPV